MSKLCTRWNRGSWIRTSELWDQNPLPYHLAIPLKCRSISLLPTAVLIGYLLIIHSQIEHCTPYLLGVGLVSYSIPTVFLYDLDYQCGQGFSPCMTPSHILLRSLYRPSLSVYIFRHRISLTQVNRFKKQIWSKFLKYF